MGLKIGDSMVLNVLGREIEGRIASFRKVDFTTGGQNFILVLSPGLIDKAPHSFLATVRVDAAGQENAMYIAVTDAFPQHLHRAGQGRHRAGADPAAATGRRRRAASLLTILAGLLVLAGAIAAGGRGRLYDATVLKVLGATAGANRAGLCPRIWRAGHRDRRCSRWRRARWRPGSSPRQVLDVPLRLRRPAVTCDGAGRRRGNPAFRPDRGAGGASHARPAAASGLTVLINAFFF